jgi:type II secretory ATPase GspE/PulE/Tfp pilus assembly ATPase PilB-like protein
MVFQEHRSGLLCVVEITAIGHSILTVENPIEYRIDGIDQIRLPAKIDFSFARSLCRMLWHDPPAMMIAEIRGGPMAQVTIRGDLTKHLVLNTPHTSDATSAIAWLVNMRIESYCTTSSLQVAGSSGPSKFLPHNASGRYLWSPPWFRQMGIAQCSYDVE